MSVKGVPGICFYLGQKLQCGQERYLENLLGKEEVGQLCVPSQQSGNFSVPMDH